MLKPIDIHNVDFKRSLKGYNPEEVDQFLATVVSKYESVYQENLKLREEIGQLRRELAEQENQGQDVLDLISLTKQTVQELKKMSQQEAANIVEAAKSEAGRIVSEAHLEGERMLSDVEIRLARTRQAETELREKVRLTMEIIWNLLTDSQPILSEKTKPYPKISAESAPEDDGGQLTSE